MVAIPLSVFVLLGFLSYLFFFLRSRPASRVVAPCSFAPVLATVLVLRLPMKVASIRVRRRKTHASSAPPFFQFAIQCKLLWGIN